MATLLEIGQIVSEAGWGDLHTKVRSAATIKAAAIMNLATPTQAQLDWAQEAIKLPYKAGDEVIYYVVATNSSASIAQILGASDTAIQNNVNDAVDKIIGA